LSAMRGNIQASIEGGVSGQVAVGNYIYQIGTVNGGVVNLQSPPTQPPYMRRAGRVSLRPRKFAAILDRESEVSEALTAFEASTSTALFGPNGVGKTALLHFLAHVPEVEQFQDGVAYLSASQRGREDLLQDLFDAFYESERGFKATTVEIQHALQGVNALILLDDISMPRDEIGALLDAAPHCTFVLGSLERSLWGPEWAIGLRGLPGKHAVNLFKGELGRELNDLERPVVAEICSLLAGHPLHILIAAAEVRESGKPLSELRAELQGKPADEAVVQLSVAGLTESQQGILGFLGALDGNPLAAEHLQALSQSEDFRADLRVLEEHRLAYANDEHYRITGGFVVTLARMLDLGSREDMLIEYFVDWLNRRPPDALMEESAEAMTASLKRAGEKHQWSQVVSLGRLLERFLILRKHWQAWSEILELVLKSARALADRSTEAWALHQLGSRALCLGAADQARQFLSQAVSIRQAIGDQAGLAISRQNLLQLPGAPFPPARPSIGKALRSLFTHGAIGAGMALVAVVLTVMASPYWLPPSPTAPPPIRQTVPVTRIVTAPPVERTVLVHETVIVTRIVTLAPPDTEGPTPTILSPADDEQTQCYSDVNLKWQASDPSGIASYRILLYDIGKRIYKTSDVGTPQPYPVLKVNSMVTVSQLEVSSYLQVNHVYLWMVQARDNAGNLGDYVQSRFRSPLACIE